MTSSTAEGPASERRPPVGELVFALGIVGLGAYAVLRAGAINEPISAGSMGPRAMPYLVGTALVLVGAAVVVSLLRGHVGQAEDGEDVAADGDTDWMRVAMLAALLLVHVFLIVPAGWPVAAAVLFAGSAVVLGARPWWRAALIGLVLALVLQAAFVGGLGVSLPAGPVFGGVPFLDG